MKTKIGRLRNRDEIRANIIRQHSEGFTLEFMATSNRVTSHTVRSVLGQLGTPAGKAPSQDPIGVHFRTVPAYRFKKCQKRNGFVPGRQTLKPCVLCLAEVGK